MMQWIAEKIVAALERQGVLRHASRDVYVYGFDIAIYTFVSTLGLFLIGWLGGRPWETIVLIALYYTNQSIGGGYHAPSHMCCFLTMVAGLAVFLLTFAFPYSAHVYLGIAMLSILLLWCFPLVLHPNKSYLAKKAPQFVKRSRQTLIGEAVLLGLVMLLGLPNNIAQTIAITLALSAVSRGIAVWQHGEYAFH